MTRTQVAVQGQDGVGAGATHFRSASHPQASHLQVRGLEVGADACLVRPVPFRELLARVHALLRRRALDNGGNGHGTVDRIAVGDIVLDRVTRQVWRAGRPVWLRRREFDLLCVLMENAGRALSRQELLRRVWGEDWVGNPRTLDVHICWLRGKLEENPSAPRYIQTLRGYGHRFGGVEVVEAHGGSGNLEGSWFVEPASSTA